jgi:hypothetical protein
MLPSQPIGPRLAAAGPRTDRGADEAFTGPYPRYSGAVSGITDGAPEDINEMPAVLDGTVEAVIYDGSDLEERDPGID